MLGAGEGLSSTWKTDDSSVGLLQTDSYYFPHNTSSDTYYTVPALIAHSGDIEYIYVSLVRERRGGDKDVFLENSLKHPESTVDDWMHFTQGITLDTLPTLYLCFRDQG